MGNEMQMKYVFELNCLDKFTFSSTPKEMEAQVLSPMRAECTDNGGLFPEKQIDYFRGQTEEWREAQDLHTVRFCYLWGKPRGVLTTSATRKVWVEAKEESDE